MSRWSAALVAAFFAFLFAAPALAAFSGLVRGTVTVDGKPLAGATVTLVGEGSQFSTKTQSNGEYVFSQVPFGNYRATASFKGLPSMQLTITVTSGTVATIDFPTHRDLTLPDVLVVIDS